MSMISLGELVQRFGGKLDGDATLTISRVAPVQQAGEGDITFISNSRYAALLPSCRASAVIVTANERGKTPLPKIITADPYLFFARVAQALAKPTENLPGCASSAEVLSELPATASIAAGVTIGRNVRLGEYVVIGPGCHIGDDCRIGDHSRLNARVVLYPEVQLGTHCLIHAGAVIGADGFGFARDAAGKWVKIPQSGSVRIGDNVEIGANTTIDRGTLGDTVIGNGVKLDNQIQIAHNVELGDDCAIAGCVGIAGSTKLGRRCMVGGQAGIIGHLTICDDVVISAGTLLTKSIRTPGTYTANLPIQTHAQWLKNFAHLRHLDQLADTVRQLEKSSKEPEAH